MIERPSRLRRLVEAEASALPASRPQGRRLIAALVGALLGLAWLGSPPAQAGGAAAPWRNAAEVSQSLFRAQEAILLADDDAAARQVRSAEGANSGAFRRRLAADSPAAARSARDGIARARRAVNEGEQVDLAAARGQVTAAVRRGAYDVAVASVTAGRADVAGDWLLVRDFRKATRFSRPAVDATAAVDQLGAGRTTVAAARTQVQKDLLDAYQARLIELVADAAVAAEVASRPAAQS